jgi:hypothetical protein
LYKYQQSAVEGSVLFSNWSQAHQTDQRNIPEDWNNPQNISRVSQDEYLHGEFICFSLRIFAIKIIKCSFKVYIAEYKHFPSALFLILKKKNSYGLFYGSVSI